MISAVMRNFFARSSIFVLKEYSNKIKTHTSGAKTKANILDSMKNKEH